MSCLGDPSDELNDPGLGFGVREAGNATDSVQPPAQRHGEPMGAAMNTSTESTPGCDRALRITSAH